MLSEVKIASINRCDLTLECDEFLTFFNLKIFGRYVNYPYLCNIKICSVQLKKIINLKNKKHYGNKNRKLFK